MPGKHGIYVYAQDCRDFSTTGLVGDLNPLEATFSEEKIGKSEIIIKMAYDEYGRWKAAKVGALIKCEVPIRIPPSIVQDQYAQNIDVSSAEE